MNILMPTQFRSYKYRLYPDKSQVNYLSQCFGAKRWIFNHFLAENKRRFSVKETHLNNFGCNLEITKLKKENDTSWLKEIDDNVLKCASEDLHVAFTNFFNSIKGKRKGPKVEAPKFKKKSNSSSFRTRGFKVDLETQMIKIPKLKTPLKIAVDRKFVGVTKSCTISKTPSGKYFVSILVEEDISLMGSTGCEVGIDLGIKDLIITSDGHKFVNPEKELVKAKQLLKKQQKILSRKARGSKNYEKQRIKVARLHDRITNFKINYYHNISSFIVKNYDAIYMEDLNVKGMLKNRCLSRTIHNISWSTLVNMISYKAMWYGRTFYQIGMFVPSSKTCSCCGYKLEVLTLDVREWQCPSCNTKHDRDLNAAINIKNFGQQDCYNITIPSNRGLGMQIPSALQKFVTKIERSDVVYNQLTMGASKPKNVHFLGS